MFLLIVCVCFLDELHSNNFYSANIVVYIGPVNECCMCVICSVGEWEAEGTDVRLISDVILSSAFVVVLCRLCHSVLWTRVC